jgi:hypothetical protein
MLAENIKIGNKIIGRVNIDTHEGKHTEIEVWIDKDLLKFALGSQCNVIHYDME